MGSRKKSICRLSILIGFLSICCIAPAQTKLGLQVEEWADILRKGKLNEVNSLGSLTNQLVEADSLRAFGFLDSLKASKKAKGYPFIVYFSMIKADFLYAKFAGYNKYKDRTSKELIPIKRELIRLYADALNAAYHIDGDVLTGWVSFYSARRMIHFGETSWAVMYSKSGVDLFEKANYPVEPPVYTSLAELLYQVREYDESIGYAKKGIEAWKKMNYETDYTDPYKYRIKALITIGTCFYSMNLHDSAHTYYQKALQLATQNKDTLLTSKVLGNIGRIIFAQKNMDSAYVLFSIDYLQHKKDSIYNEAANASQWMAKASLVMGRNSTALAEAKESIRLLGLWPNDPYLRDTYHTLTQVYRAIRNYDSAFYYNDRYKALNDSLEKEVATSSLAISKARLNDEVSRFNIQKLNKEKESQLLLRNIIIAGIVLLFLIILLFLNRKRLKEKIKIEKVEQEMVLAKEQMKMFTNNLIEKTNLIERLQMQIKDKAAITEQNAIISELSQHTILTEQDWSKFKTLFETIYPDFFKKLKDKFSDITVGEQRTAALIRLQLTTKQIASILGISADSVHKSRQRLRQRFQVDLNANLEELMVNL